MDIRSTLGRGAEVTTAAISGCGRRSGIEYDEVARARPRPRARARKTKATAATVPSIRRAEGPPRRANQRSCASKAAGRARASRMAATSAGGDGACTSVLASARSPTRKGARTTSDAIAETSGCRVRAIRLAARRATGSSTASAETRAARPTAAGCARLTAARTTLSAMKTVVSVAARGTNRSA